MELDPIIVAALELTKGQPPISSLSVEQVRDGMAQRVEMLRGLAPAEIDVVDLVIAGPGGPLPVRLYRPAGTLVSARLPVILFLHGGGWALGSIETHDNVCRFLAQEGPLLVASVDYRLAPEHKSPAQQQDAMAALRWAAAEIAQYGGDPHRLIVGGDSAGGNLAALAALEARDHGPKLAGQLLVYPVTDFPADGHASYAENAEFGLDRELMEWFWGHWLEDGAAPDENTAPLRHPDLSGLPPARVITASHDVLRDEGKAYSARLAEAGALAAHDHVEGVNHGFFSMGGLLPAATETLQRAARWAASLPATG